MSQLICQLGKIATEEGKLELLIRFRVNHKMYCSKTGIFMESSQWDPHSGMMRDVRLQKYADENTVNRKLQERRFINKVNHMIMELKDTARHEYYKRLNQGELDAKWLQDVVSNYMYPKGDAGSDIIEEEEEQTTNYSILDIIDEFIEHHTPSELSDVRKKNYRVIQRMLGRYSLYANDPLELNSITADTIADFHRFILIENSLLKKTKKGVSPKRQFKRLYDQFPEERLSIEQRAENTATDYLKKVRAIIRWAKDVKGYTSNNPFNKYKLAAEKYGKPYYLTKEQRDTLYHFDLSVHPQLAIQRDIFIFQCLTGCRVSDLMRLTKNNIVSGNLEYYPQKTKESNGRLVSVPLSSTAREIISKYIIDSSGPLFPFSSQVNYNIDIKKIFTLAGLTDMVTVLNPVTKLEEQRPLNEIASSHLARRTFVGIMYNEVPDPNIIGSMSGHVPGSKAFERYHDYSNELKQKAVKLLE